ncbi:MAG: NUDIX hydrolase [Desulfobacula sp.]|jgi:ADP-ribose pyrophosphatase YjhB (NUDIX family)|uniref:NUDIX hydrolase n=1 Tax=Desulfobacula sp. TaxID=2593537 RepID=UPI001DA99EAC|nr:NUDIX hydrolase [Desulfobacula sp.]MBT3486930.1 NUDIX hydrolase [Desulfobacula sp.]MBT4508702.1 NUDIX hydrolase [Desulfobacula sp.]MBT4875363.1 NUDIX hydrolase [Desulfobacula sp.]MBT5546324.1 NUDIX hydrolase [Desulfobacula sp.]
MDIKFCTACGSPTEQKIPIDDDHVRSICTNCAQIHYNNPKMVVGSIPELNKQILLCKRNIEPCKGKWTLPAGYLENGESVQDGAMRETFEETMAEVEIIEPYRLFNIVFVDQIYFMFRADLMSDKFGPTNESTDVRLFDEKDIPWKEIAFEVIKQTLAHYFKDRKKGMFPFKIFDLN